MKNYIVEHGLDSDFSDGEYEYYGVYNKDGDICAIFYVDAIPNAEAEAQALCDQLNIEPAPKYDPCRRFRKGDKVEYHPKDGRELFEAKRLLAQTLTVVENEHKEYNRVTVEAQNGDTLSVPFYYLKLVTPVEELERYVVEPSDVAYFIVDKKHEIGEKNVVMYMFAFHPNAKAAAEAECARLNAEHRKEQNNG